MESIKKHHYLIAGLVIVLVIAGNFLYSKPAEAPVAPEPEEVVAEMSATTAVSLTIGDGYTNDTVSFTEGTTALTLLTELNSTLPELQLQTETYDGLGTLVTNMFGLENGQDNSYWQYTVDGVMPQVGADQYMLTAGENIVWSFGTSAY